MEATWKVDMNTPDMGGEESGALVLIQKKVLVKKLVEMGDMGTEPMQDGDEVIDIDDLTQSQKKPKKK